MTRMLKKYKETVVPTLKEEFAYSSAMQVPRLEKIVLNCGVGEAASNSKVLEHVEYSLAQISGQKPVITRAKKSIANYKLRKGLPLGCMVTLRKQRMYEFLDRLISVALPRVRDFKGIPTKGFDGRGNYTLGVKEQMIFPEIDVDKLDKIRGLNITFCTSARNDKESRALLQHLGMPFRK